MTIEITWIHDGKRDVPHILTNQKLVSHEILREAKVGGKKVIEITMIEYTIAKAVKATPEQVRKWRE